MQRFPLVQSLDGLKAKSLSLMDPGAKVNPADAIGEIRCGEKLGAMLSQEAAAGRPVVLKLFQVNRADGVFLVAGELIPMPVATQEAVKSEYSQSAPPAGDKVSATEE